MNRIAKSVFRTLVIACFAVWFGGFFFYVAFVVPVGTDVLGSAREQGFITRLVAHRLNAMCAMALLAMTIASLVGWHRAGWMSRIMQVGSLIAIGALLIWLVILHPQLDNLLEIEDRRVSDRGVFYQLHRVYLWASTFQWIFAWTWLLPVINDWIKETEISNKHSVVQTEIQ